MKYEKGDRVLYNDGKRYVDAIGTVVEFVKSRCKCKGRGSYHVTLDEGIKITVIEKKEHMLSPLTMDPSTNIPPIPFG